MSIWKELNQQVVLEVQVKLKYKNTKKTKLFQHTYTHLPREHQKQGTKKRLTRHLSLVSGKVDVGVVSHSKHTDFTKTNCLKRSSNTI